MPAPAVTAQSLKKPLAALLLLALAIGATGYYYLEHQLASARRAAHQELSAIADLKVSQITSWLDERRGNAGAIIKNPIMRQQVGRFMRGQGDPGLVEELRSWLEGMALRYNYEQLAFYDTQGTPRLGAPWPLPVPDQEGLVAALASPDVTLADLHLVGTPTPEGRPLARLALWAPIAGGEGKPALGAMQLLIDPRVEFYPMLQAWPTPSPSAEVLLVRREGEEALFLNELRHRNQPPLAMREPLTPDSRFPVVMALQGRTIPIDGTMDRRGVPVLAVSRPVPGTPWFLVAKVDVEEVHAGLRSMAWTTGLVMVLLLLAAAAGLGLFWRRRDNQWLRLQLAVDHERRELARRVMQLNDQANDIVLLVDDDWQILEANQRALTAYGYTQREMLGMNGRDLRAPEASQDFEAQTSAEALRAGAVYETVHQRKDGSTFPVEVSIRQVELGRQTYRQSFIRDITERRLAQQELAKSAAELAAIFHGAPIMMVLVDQDRRVRKANLAALEAAGRKAGEAMGLRGGELLRCLHALDDPRGCGFGPTCQDCHVKEAVLHTLQTGEPLHRREAQLKMERPEGPTDVYLLVSTSRLPGEGAPLALVCLEDVTQRQRAEAALKTSEARFRRLFDDAPLAYQSLDEDGRILEVNQAWLAALGYTREQVLGKWFGSFLPDEFVPHFQKNFPCFKDAGHIEGVEFEMLRADGSTMLVSFNGAIGRDSLGTFKQTHCIFLDITERRRAEEALRASEEKFSKAFHSAPLLLTLSALEDGTFLEVNEKFLEVSGFSRQEVLGHTSVELGWLKAQDRPRILEELSRAGRVSDMELELTAKDGHTVYCLFQGELISIAGRECLLTIAMDISQRRQAEQALGESLRQSAMLAEMLANSSQPFAVGYPDGRLGIHNQAFLDLVGYSAEELRGLEWSKGLTPERWREREAASLAELVSTGRPVRYEKEYIRKDGSLVPIELLVNMVRDQGGGVEYFYAFVTDVSDRKQAEGERRAHIGFLESLARIDQAIKAETDVERMLWRAVRTAFEIFSCDRAWLFYPGDPQAQTFRVPVEICRDEYPGAGLLNTDLPLPPDMAADLAQILKSEDPTIFGPDQEKPVNTLSAQRFGVQSQITLPVYPKTGKPWIFGMHQCSHPRQWTADERRLFREIGRRLADGLSSLLFLRELKESEKRYRTTFEQTAVGMVQTDPHGTFLWVNQRFCDFLGYAPHELVGLKVSDVTVDEEITEDDKQLSLLRAGRTQGFSRSKRYRRKDGTVVWGRVTVSPARDEKGQTMYNIAVVEDITEQRLLEAQLRQAQKMEAMGTLAGGIAHDFNNILGAVLGYAEIALDDARAGRLDNQDLEQVIQAALRAKNLVKQILTFSRRSEADLRPLDLNQTVAQTRGMLERTLPKMIEIVTNLAPDLHPVNGDPNQLEQVLLNLATNAQDAMPQGGRLLIETQNVTLDSAYASQHPEVPPGRYALLTVSDTGQGMDAATRDKAFDPFFTTKEVGRGTGLGLSMVYGIVKAHRGHVFCQSAPGQGTTFKVYLPTYQEQPPAEAGQEGTPDTALLRGVETILLVDDEEPLRLLGGRILEGMGYRVLTAKSGEEALRVYQGLSERPALVVMDLGMPGMGGLRCLERLLALEPDLKVIIASGYSADAQVKQALQAGAQGYVSKPFRRLELLGQVRAVLDRPQGLNPQS